MIEFAIAMCNVEKEKFKMTREEAKSKMRNVMTVGNFSEGGIEGMLRAFEALGLLKFEEEKPVRKLCSAGQGGNHGFNFRVEEWADDKYVLWYDGQIVWRSWTKA